MAVRHDKLAALTAAIFTHAGSSDDEAETIARHLIEANLVGHDSHGVIRVPAYVQWVGDGKLVPNQSISVVFENDVVAIVEAVLLIGISIPFWATVIDTVPGPETNPLHVRVVAAERLVFRGVKP